MTDRARKVLHDALELPLPERAELAADLLACLDGESEADVETAWASEIERRASDALANPDDDVAWEALRDDELHGAPRRSASPCASLARSATSSKGQIQAATRRLGCGRRGSVLRQIESRS
jgi:putative addiction module component (TIGR02574 family)